MKKFQLFKDSFEICLSKKFNLKRLLTKTWKLEWLPHLPFIKELNKVDHNQLTNNEQKMPFKLMKIEERTRKLPLWRDYFALNQKRWIWNDGPFWSENKKKAQGTSNQISQQKKGKWPKCLWGIGWIWEE